jgi:L-ribulose-5-phosphate 3-epimerase
MSPQNPITPPTRPTRVQLRQIMLSRRIFLASAAATALTAAPSRVRLRIGTMDGVFQMAGKPESVALAQKLGLAAMQVTLGRSTDGRTLPLEDPALQAAWRKASRDHKVPLTSTYIDMLHADCLKDNANAPMWVRKGISVTKELGASTLMLVFFGKCQVLERAELDRAIALSKELAPEAEKAGVILGFENTSSGKDNLYAVDQVASKAFRVWYDIGNSTYNGYDVPSEIRALGRERICAFHIKDKGYLGEGKVDVAGALKAIGDIRFSGDAILETGSPSGDVEADARRNVAYLRKLIGPA